MSGLRQSKQSSNLQPRVSLLVWTIRCWTWKGKKWAVRAEFQCDPFLRYRSHAHSMIQESTAAYNMTTRNCPFSCSAALNRANRSRILSNGPVQLLLLGICVLGSKHSELSSQFIIQPLLCFVTSKEILSHLVVELANYDLLSLSLLLPWLHSWSSRSTRSIRVDSSFVGSALWQTRTSKM